MWFCWHATKLRTRLEAIWQRHGVLMHQQVVWVKTCPVLNRLGYMAKHESCLMGWLKGNAPEAKGRTEYPPDVWEFPNKGPDDKIEHPTVKPVGVFTIPMLQHTERGDICYEPFAGSGTQLVAAEQLGRVCYAMEIEPKYVAVALERLSGMGLEPKLESG